MSGHDSGGRAVAPILQETAAPRRHGVNSRLRPRIGNGAFSQTLHEQSAGAAPQR
jgi:hypothetical protein